MFLDYFLFQIESEENVLICLHIIIELHKQFRPPISQEVSGLAPIAYCSFQLMMCISEEITWYIFLLCMVK